MQQAEERRRRQERGGTSSTGSQLGFRRKSMTNGSGSFWKHTGIDALLGEAYAAGEEAKAEDEHCVPLEHGCLFFDTERTEFAQHGSNHWLHDM